MVGLAGGSVSGYLRVNPRSARLRMFVFFEHKHPGTFSEDKAVAIGRKRTRRALRLIIPRLCKGANHGVALHNSFRNRRIDPSSDKHGLDASLNVLVGITKSVSG